MGRNAPKRIVRRVDEADRRTIRNDFGRARLAHVFGAPGELEAQAKAAKRGAWG